MALNHFYFLILFIHSSQRDGSMEVFLPSSGKQSTHTRWQWKCYEQDANQHPELKQTRGSNQIPKKKTQGKVHIFFSSPTPPCHHHVLRIFFYPVLFAQASTISPSSFDARISSGCAAAAAAFLIVPSMAFGRPSAFSARCAAFWPEIIMAPNVGPCNNEFVQFQERGRDYGEEFDVFLVRTILGAPSISATSMPVTIMPRTRSSASPARSSPA